MGKKIVDYCTQQPLNSALLALALLLLVFGIGGFFLRIILLAVLLYTALQVSRHLDL